MIIYNWYMLQKVCLKWPFLEMEVFSKKLFLHKLNSVTVWNYYTYLSILEIDFIFILI